VKKMFPEARGEDASEKGARFSRVDLPKRGGSDFPKRGRTPRRLLRTKRKKESSLYKQREKEHPFVGTKGRKKYRGEEKNSKTGDALLLKVKKKKAAPSPPRLKEKKGDR